nr:MAG TPA: hypothetical protein [Bacteriophage sp.]
MTILKGVAVTLDLIFFVIFLAVMSLAMDEETKNPLVTAFFVLLEIGFTVNAAVIFRL